MTVIGIADGIAVRLGDGDEAACAVYKQVKLRCLSLVNRGLIPIRVSYRNMHPIRYDSN